MEEWVHFVLLVSCFPAAIVASGLPTTEVWVGLAPMTFAALSHCAPDAFTLVLLTAATVFVLLSPSDSPASLELLSLEGSLSGSTAISSLIRLLSLPDSPSLPTCHFDGASSSLPARSSSDLSLASSDLSLASLLPFDCRAVARLAVSPDTAVPTASCAHRRGFGRR